MLARQVGVLARWVAVFAGQARNARAPPDRHLPGGKHAYPDGKHAYLSGKHAYLAGERGCFGGKHDLG